MGMLLALVLGISSVQANTHKLICYGEHDQSVLEVLLGTGNLINAVMISHQEKDLIQDLLTPQEAQQPDFKNESTLVSVFRKGKCELGAPDLLVFCSVAANDFSVSKFGFEYGQPRPFIVEHPVSLKSLFLSVKKEKAIHPVIQREYNAAVLNLDFTTQNGIRTIYSKVMGEFRPESQQKSGHCFFR